MANAPHHAKSWLTPTHLLAARLVGTALGSLIKTLGKPFSRKYLPT
jgi:hypothetical protein